MRKIDPEGMKTDYSPAHRGRTGWPRPMLSTQVKRVSDVIGATATQKAEQASVDGDTAVGPLVEGVKDAGFMVHI